MDLLLRPVTNESNLEAECTGLHGNNLQELFIANLHLLLWASRLSELLVAVGDTHATVNVSL